ncbi:MAG: hypothetical protein AAF747_02975 [Planctomycetota bacterium]
MPSQSKVLSLPSLIVAILVATLAPASLAQAAAQPTSGTRTTLVEFSDTPLVQPAMGLRMEMPVGASWEVTTFGGTSSIPRVLLPQTSGIINIEESRAPDKSLGQVADDVILAFAQRNGIGRINVQEAQDGGWNFNDAGIVEIRSGLLARQSDLRINGVPAERFWLRMEGPRKIGSTGKEPDEIRGYTILEPNPGRFITLELRTLENTAQYDKDVYTLIVETVQLEDPQNAEELRRLGIQAGVQVLGQLTPADYARAIQAIGKDWRWERLYRPGGTGAPEDDQEIGYRGIQAEIGTRGQIEGLVGDRIAEGELGYIVRIKSRSLVDNQIIDSQGTYFLSQDRQEEAWSIKLAIRRPGDDQFRRASTETAFRSGNSMQIDTRLDRGDPITIKPRIDGQGYISQVEAYLLPQLLIPKGIKTDFRFYRFNSSAGRIRLRQDIVTNPEPNRWIFETMLTEDAKHPQHAIYDANANLIAIRLKDQDGGDMIWAPTTLSELLRLWELKNLPLD